MARPEVPADEPELSPEEGTERFSAAAEAVAGRLEQRAECRAVLPPRC